jgi:NAD-dependent deacetylase
MAISHHDMNAVTLLAERLRTAPRVSVMTGAGVSAASGVPTFRGNDGLWRQYRATDLATPEAFARDRALVWDWYQWRRSLIAACAPNPAHEVLARWSQREGWRIVTQNVDDLHLRAGTNDLIRLHGSIWELFCAARCAGGHVPWRDERTPIPSSELICRSCGGPARPGIVWFGESLDPRDVTRAGAAARCDVFIAAGTSAIVYPAAGLIDVARQAGAFTVEINTETTDASGHVDLAIRGAAEEIFPAVDRLLTAG